ncbi:MAG: hypothetical protein HUU35_08270, partial [Armatimonadetes bacterium]|nr:hypothetical protein [Armatimonadota bacterium]
QAALTWPGGEPLGARDLPLGSPRAKAVTWIGFINNADRAGTWYLDNVKLSNSAAEG